jgi:hypothetical protein
MAVRSGPIEGSELGRAVTDAASLFISIPSPCVFQLTVFSGGLPLRGEANRQPFTLARILSISPAVKARTVVV